MATPQIDIPREQLAAFCQKWRIIEFALFGSVLRDDFRPDSDIDVLVTFAPDARIGLFDLVQIREELVMALGREVDLVERTAIESTSANPYRRRAILSTAKVIHAAA